MNQHSLTFRQVDFDRDGDVCVQFRADAAACGVGTPDGFLSGAGPGGRDYIAAMKSFAADLPGGCVHVWSAGRVIGQVELMRDRADASAGKVNLFYLVPEYRGRGLGKVLERYALGVFSRAGFSRAWLRVAAANDTAVQFYARRGWVDCGADAREPDSRIMRKPVAPDAGVRPAG
jgi:GNAT superfamily N-acetyltransferase